MNRNFKYYLEQAMNEHYYWAGFSKWVKPEEFYHTNMWYFLIMAAMSGEI